ncbi:MAG: hypothetical protein JWN52_5434 [Actinomycetia bacterium]|nr:hypothetical protein [Actinomycetes bacterium]
MRAYSKAYQLSEIRRFPGWPGDAQAQLPDGEIVYLCDDFSVLADPIEGHETLFSSDSAEWREFCVNILEFAIPEDLAFVRAEPAGD